MGMLITTGFFRSGSTFLFGAMRASPSIDCYYEPLHPKLLTLAEDSLTQVKHSNLRHSEQNPWAEYQNPSVAKVVSALHVTKPQSCEGLSSAVSSVCESYNYLDPKKVIADYIDNLSAISKARCKVPFFGFNRLNYTLGIYRSMFPEAAIVYSRRSPISIALSIASMRDEGQSDTIFSTQLSYDHWGIEAMYNMVIARQASCLASKPTSLLAKICVLVALSDSHCIPASDFVVSPEMAREEYMSVVAQICDSVRISSSEAVEYVAKRYKRAARTPIPWSLLTKTDYDVVSFFL